jgi:hypothetical protein
MHRNTGRIEHATLELSKLGTMDVDYHHLLSEDGTIKQVRLKKKTQGRGMRRLSLITVARGESPRLYPWEEIKMWIR